MSAGDTLSTTHPESATTPVMVWGLPLAPLTMTQTLDAIAEMISSRTPRFVVTANLNYAMITDSDVTIQDLNTRAALILADGMPLVWASRLRSRHLPERVAGSDLLIALCERAAQERWGIYFLGGGEGVAQEAAQRLTERFPSLRIVGMDTPPFRNLSIEEQQQIIQRIRAAQPDLLFVAFGQPKGERWIDEHLDELGVPVSMQVGASLDFAAGRVRRAPRWIQASGLEWLYRIYQEPRRLLGRYIRNAWFMMRMILASVIRKPKRSK